MGNALESFSVKTQPVCNDIVLYQLVRREYLRHFEIPVLNLVYTSDFVKGVM